MPVKSIFEGSTFNTAHTYANLSTCSCEREKKRKSLNDFKFGTCIGRFPSDVAARMAVKGLIIRPEDVTRSSDPLGFLKLAGLLYRQVRNE